MIAAKTESSSKKYREIEALWRREIADGKWRPGDRLPTFAELGVQYDVSRSTIERVCRNLEQDGLIRRRQGSGVYIAEPAAEPEIAHDLVGVVGWGFQEKPQLSYWTALKDGIQYAARQEGKGIVLLDLETPAGWDKIDGLLVADGMAEPIPSLADRLPEGVAVVSIFSRSSSVPCVMADDHQGGQLATRHLLELGHRRIACLMDSANSLTMRRLSGYREALTEFGIVPEPEWIRACSDPARPSPDFVERGRAVMNQWLQENWSEMGCTALLAQNDLVAIGAIKALQDGGFGVPTDVSVIGFDNIDVCEYVSPRLTSIAVPLFDIGVTAAEILLRLIETGQNNSMTTLAPVHLQVRDSTAVCPNS